jgi:hypothetical protein
MRHAKVQPIIMSHEPLQLRPAENWEENYGSGRRRHGREFWYARREFLKSYHFSEQNGSREKLKRWAKELNELANGVVSDIRRQMSKRRVGIRAYRFTLALPSHLVLLTVRCFTPWLNKKECLQP